MALLATAAPHRPAAGQDPGTTLWPPVTLFGEVRSRSEWDRPGGSVQPDLFTYLRSRLGVRVDPSSAVRVVMQLQDSRVLGSSTTAANSIDLHQAYIDLSDGASMTWRAGRQEIALGNERLVGPVNWSNTGRSLDGVRLVMQPKGGQWAATAFAAVAEERGRHFGTETTPDDDRTVAGVFASRSLGSATFESTLLYDGTARYRSYVDARRYTIDSRFRSPRITGLRMGVDLEAALQFGRQEFAPGGTPPAPTVGQRVAAWLAGVRVGGITAPTSPRAWLGVDWLSGDATPADGSYSAFSTMYATNHPFYGTLDLIADPATSTRDRGLVDLLAVAVLPIRRASVRIETHRFLLASAANEALGFEADASIARSVGGAGRLELAYSTFAPATAAKTVGLATTLGTKQGMYLQLTAAF
jgi:hypothetical protein